MENKTMKKKIDIGKPASIHPLIKKSTVQKLMKALKYFAEETRRLNMRQWGILTPLKAHINNDIIPPCRTQACIAGSILLTSGDQKIKEILNHLFKIRENAHFEIVFPGDSSELATKILGITKKQADSLFYFKGWNGGKNVGWPIKYSTAYMAAQTADERFAAAKARVFHFIETGK